jgi:hypothetical protein
MCSPCSPSKPTSWARIPESVTTINLERSNSGSLHDSFRVRFLQSASAKASTEASRDVLTRYTMNSLKAAYLRIDLTEGGSIAYQDQVQTTVNEKL